MYHITFVSNFKNRVRDTTYFICILQTGPRALRVASAKHMFPLEQTWSIVTSRIHGEHRLIVSSGAFKLVKHTGFFYQFKVKIALAIASSQFRGGSIYLIRAGARAIKSKLSREAARTWN